MSPAYHRPKVLVLEDEPAEARLVSRILEDDGFDVETVGTGEEALGKLAVEHYCPYELVLLDLMMSGLSGLHVVRFILNHRREILDRILITSAASPREHPEMIGSAAVTIPWLRKPYRPEDLLDLAKDIVDCSVPPSPAWLSFR